MTVRERALELLHEVAGLLEQLLGEVEEDSIDPSTSVESSAEKPEPIPEEWICSQGGVHVAVNVSGHTYCEKCNKLLETEE